MEKYPLLTMSNWYCSVLSAVYRLVLGPIGLALFGMGVGFVQADEARQQLVKTAKKELVKYLPQVANEQWLPVHDAVKECFDAYEREVTIGLMMIFSRAKRS